MKLNDLATVYSGYSFRTKVRHNRQGDVSVVQMRDLSQDYTEIGTKLDRIDSPDMKGKYFLSKNDLLLVGKGGNNHAVLCDSLPDKTIASSGFFIIKPNTQKIHTGYFHWLLNHPKTQVELKKQQSGTYTPTLKIGAIQNLNIVLPSKEKQIKIATLYRLQIRERQLQNRLVEKRKTLLDNLLISAIQA